MAIRIFQHYWQLPLALLALVEAVVFFLAPYAAALLRLDATLPEVEEILGPLFPRGLLFASVFFTSM
ncbi:MAG TPA: hypothetical protein VJ837_04155, partial [Candidatus Paceibacterota bacterium]|nr:hypothetical protein [Candidatus Paceibacterota bacterium]